MCKKLTLCHQIWFLYRHFKQVPNINITKDMEFNEANQLYEAQCTELKKPGPTETEPSIKNIYVYCIDAAFLTQKTLQVY